jgi:hypothetical protein
MSAEPGILAIFNDCREGREAEFETWYQGEHLLERLSVPGFLFGRRFESVSATPRYFAFYLVESPAVLTSKPYLERLDNPTLATRKMMAEVFVNMNRTVCRRSLRRGRFRGAFAAVLRLNQKPDEAALIGVLDRFMASAGVAGGEIWMAVDPASMPVSKEEQMRGGDKKITGALMIETLFQDDAVGAAAQLAEQFPAADIGVYRLLCEIGRSDL